MKGQYEIQNQKFSFFNFIGILAISTALAGLLTPTRVEAVRRVDVHSQNDYFPNQTLVNNTIYTILDEPLSCSLLEQCLLRSVGFVVKINYGTNTPKWTNAPVRFNLELWEKDLLIESVPLTIGTLASGTYLMGKGLNSQRALTPTSGTHVKFKVRTGAVGNFNWPTIVQITPKYGVGTESVADQAFPNSPTLFDVVLNPSVNQLSLKMQTLTRVDGTYMDPLESPGFLMSHRSIKTDVDMITYQKTEVLAALSSATVPTDVSATNGVMSNLTFRYPTWGHYQTEFRTQDFEGKSSPPNLIQRKVNAYSAPSSPFGSWHSVRGFASFSWEIPVKHTNGSPIDPAGFQGYIISLRDVNTGQILYSYKVLGYSQNSFNTPNLIPRGQYNFSVCGWSRMFVEGECAISGQVVTYPPFIPPAHKFRRHGPFHR